MNDRLNNLTEREKRILENSWAKPFAEKIFPLIEESRFSALYCNDNGRPNTPVNIVIGSLLLKELTHETDEELNESINLDPRYQYALHLTSYNEIPFSDRTVSRFRERLYRHELETGEDLIKDEIERLADEFTKRLKVDGKLKRMDSAMVSSSCKKMGRLELIYTCVSKMVKALVKSDGIDVLPKHFMKYAEESDKNSVCYRMEKDEVATRLEDVTADALLVYELTSEMSGVEDEYRLLGRMLTDQTDGKGLKPNSKVSARSLQNPSDEEATFRRKAGKGYQGYVANIVEDCGKDVNIITQYEYDINVHSDIDFAAETIEKLGKQEEQKVVLIADGAYASDDNFNEAEKNNIELVTTMLTGQAPSKTIADFQIEDNKIISCPTGHSPTDCVYKEEKGIYRAHFDKAVCENCLLRKECNVTLQKKRALVKITTLAVKRAQYMKKLSTGEYKEYARKRNGIEGIPSILRRRYGVDRMPVRGLMRSKMWFGFKIGAINIKRVIVAVQNSQFLYNLNRIYLMLSFSLT
jgi:hypothetical protein